MKPVAIFFSLLLAVTSIPAITNSEPFELTARIGFVDGRDFVVSHNLLEGGRILLIGKKTIQVWNYETGKMLLSSAHNIDQFKPDNAFSRLLLLNLPAVLSWRPYAVHPDGRWLITLEKTSKGAPRTAVVREINSLKQIAELKIPGISIDKIYFDKDSNEIRASARSDEDGAFATWNADTFEETRLVKMDKFKIYRFLENSERVLVGSGDTKLDWFGVEAKQGNTLTLHNAKTGNIEREFTADGFDPKSFYTQTTVTKDEKYVLSFRSGEVVVWEMDGDGSPRYRVSSGSEDLSLELLRVVGPNHFVVAVDEALLVYAIDGDGKPAYSVKSETPGDTMMLLDTSRDGKYIAVGDDTNVFLYETAGDGTPVARYQQANETERFKTVAFIDDLNLLSIGRANRSEGRSGWTDFYSVSTGKFESKATVGFSPSVFAIPGQDYLFDVFIGGAITWDFKEEASYFISLNFYQPQYDASDETNAYLNEMPYPTEFIRLSPDGRHVVRFGDDVATVYDLTKREEVQRLFDKDRVKYSKKTGDVKKSGIRTVSWTPDGRYVFGYDSKSRVINFWKLQ